MPTATHPDLDPDTIDDLLFLARTGETSELTDTLSHLANSHTTTPSTLLPSCIDPDSGNSTLHMASANGHTGTFPSFLLPETHSLIFPRNNSHPPQTLNTYPQYYQHLLRFPTRIFTSTQPPQLLPQYPPPLGRPKRTFRCCKNISGCWR